MRSVTVDLKMQSLHTTVSAWKLSLRPKANTARYRYRLPDEVGVNQFKSVRVKRGKSIYKPITQAQWRNTTKLLVRANSYLHGVATQL